MKLLHRKILLGFALSAALACHAQSTDSVASPADYALLPVRHVWLQTTNPVAYEAVDGSRMNTEFLFYYSNGDYKHLTDPESPRGGIVSFEGFKQVNKLHFYGSFSYDIAKLEGQRWNDVLMPSPGNPFLLGDSIGGDYNNELFEIKGAVASSFSDRLKWGVSARYKGGSSANQNDPRPLINAVRYSISPGILYDFSPWAVGLDIGYEGYNEFISISSVETNLNHSFFIFQGLGNYFARIGTGYSRRYKGSAWNGNIQLNWRNNQTENILQIGYRNMAENSEDGVAKPTAEGRATSNPFKSGDYQETTYSVLNILAVKNGQTTHLATLRAAYLPSKGTWYDQREIIDSNQQTIWEIYNQSVKYKDNTTTVGLAYTWQKEKNGFNDYLLGASADFDNHETTLYPDMQQQKYSNLAVALRGEKTFWLPKQFQLGVSAGLTYRMNLAASADFAGITLAGLWSQSVYEYLTSDHYGGVARVKLSKRMRLGKLPSIVYWIAGIDYTRSTLETESFDQADRMNLTTSIGFTF